MKLFYRALMAFLLASSVSMAAQAGDIAVISMQEIMRQSTAAQSLKTQLEAKQKTLQAEVKAKEESLQKEEAALSKERSALSAEAFKEKVKAFSKKASDAQRDVQQKKGSIDKGMATALGEIQKAVNAIVNDMAKEKGFKLALPTSQIIYADTSMDITSEVLAKLNAKLPKVSL